MQNGEGLTLRRALQRGLRNPRLAISVAMALLRGRYYRLKFRLTGQRVIIGRRFRVQGKLIIRGPGTVIFGDDCGVCSPLLSPTTPYTQSPDAVIRFGNRVLLTGCRIGCQSRIEVEDGAGVAETTLIDSDYHSVEVTDQLRYKTGTVVAKPIRIGRNAWIGYHSIVLKGVSVGENSVVGAGAVVTHSVPDNAVVFGNPARVIWPLRAGAKSDEAEQEEPSAAYASEGS